MKIDAKQDVLVIYFFFRDIREIIRSYKNTDKSEKQRIKLIEMTKTVQHHKVIELNYSLCNKSLLGDLAFETSAKLH